MVLIKKLEARGFKSLGTRLISLEFGKGLTVVTGPNGSGKSNVIDAMSFCLGENSPRALRVNRLVSLIYDGGGNESQKPLNTRVSLTFDNYERTIPVDSDQVIITRELRQDGENVYYLNGRRVQKSALSEILDIARIKPSSLNVTPQGLSTRISELLPDQKRGLIEEIVGVGQFDAKKNEAMKQLQDADVKLKIAMARIGEIKKTVENLESQRNDQLRLKHLEEDIRWLKAVGASRNLYEIRRRIQQEKGDIAEYQKTIMQNEEKLDEQKKLLTNLEVDKNHFIETVVQGGGSSQIELQFKIGHVSNEVERLDSELKEADSLVARLETSLPSLQTTYQEQLSQATRTETRIADLSGKLKDLEKVEKETDNNLEENQRQLERKRKQLERNRHRLDDLQEKIKRRNEAIARISVDMQTVLYKKGQVEERLNNLKEKNRSFNQTLEDLQKSIAELQKLKDTDETTLTKVEESMTSLEARKRAIEEEVKRATSVVQAAGQSLLRYETEISVAEKVAVDDLSISRFEELAADGALDGYLGRLEQLISFNKKYEQAMLAAGRRWMKSIVVKDVNTMIKIAEQVKKLRLGRLRFIPLSEVVGSSKISRPYVPGVIGTLAKFVSSEPDYSALVNFVFGDAILVDSAKTGYLVSSKGFRSVTLSGDIFEPNGSTFETGYLSNIEKVVSLVQSEAELGAIKEALTSLEKVISKRKSDLEALEKESTALHKEKFKKSISLERLEAELKSIARFTKKYEALQNSIQRKLDSIIAARDKLLRQTEGYNSIRDRLTSKIQEYERKTSSIDTHSLEMELSDLENARTTYLNLTNDLTNQTRETNTALAKERGNLELNYRPVVQKLEEDISRYEEQLLDRKKFLQEGNVRLQELSKNLAALKEEEARLIEASKQSKPILEDYDRRIDILRSAADSTTRSLNSFEKQLVLANKNLERIIEDEQRALGELSLYGYSGPIEIFDSSERVLEELVSEYGELKNNVNFLADSNYKEVFGGYKNLSIRSNQLESERDAIVRFIESIESEKKKIFMEAFQKIDRELRAIFNKLTSGSAWLELENPDDIFSSGVLFMTQFPGKIPRESSSVSGGEKTVSAITLILAIQSVYPSPFYLFDEIDAHLDPVNAGKLADLLKEKGEQTQVICVSLKDSMVAKASNVYGGYMADGVSRIVRYKPGIEVTVPNE